MQSSLAFSIVLVATSALTVLAVLLLCGAFRHTAGAHRAAGAQAGPAGLGDGGDAAFLFDAQVLIDTNPPGAALLDRLRGTGREAGDWHRLMRFLAQDFPDLRSVLAELPLSRHARLRPVEPHGVELTLDWMEGVLRLTLVDTAAADGTLLVDRLSWRATQDELGLLRRLVEAAPLLLWREGAGGQVTWANDSYLNRLALQGAGERLSWPLPALFPPGGEGRTQRAALHPPGGGRAAWFDLSRVPEARGMLCYALPADDAQRAEIARHDFVQTLTKTFATLPTGLALFDRTRRLQLFNPALTDLTGLETEFLLSRPGIEGFLNRMRDKHVMPEPRDFRSWSKRLLEIESTATAGGFEETWTLPSGQTFHVSATPHPDGALAFLIDDISSEMRLTQTVRAEMDTSQSVLNQLDEAIAVFTAAGDLVLTNTAFTRLWRMEGEESLGAVTLPRALEIWRAAGGDPAMWSRIAALTRPGRGEGPPVQGDLRLGDGPLLRVDARRTSTGALMIAFAPDASPARDLVPGEPLRFVRANA